MSSVETLGTYLPPESRNTKFLSCTASCITLPLRNVIWLTGFSSETQIVSRSVWLVNWSFPGKSSSRWWCVTAAGLSTHFASNRIWLVLLCLITGWLQAWQRILRSQGWKNNSRQAYRTSIKLLSRLISAKIKDWWSIIMIILKECYIVCAYTTNTCLLLAVDCVEQCIHSLRTFHSI